MLLSLAARRILCELSSLMKCKFALCANLVFFFSYITMDPSPQATALVSFLSAFPAFASSFNALRSLRKTEYERLGKEVYLDYTAACLYPRSLVEEHQRWLLHALAGNPHSVHPPSALSTRQEHSARCAVLEFFNASSEEYDLIWTSNASGALRILGESFPFDKKSKLLLSADNHNSANGIREVRIEVHRYCYVM